MDYLIGEVLLDRLADSDYLKSLMTVQQIALLLSKWSMEHHYGRRLRYREALQSKECDFGLTWCGPRGLAVKYWALINNRLFGHL